LHRDNFLKLVKVGFYDSILFHRVINNFMIQAGDPNSKTAAAGVPLGNGGPGYTIPAEFRASLFHKKGMIAAARMGDGVNPTKASSGSQFYIVQGSIVPELEMILDRQNMGTAMAQMQQSGQFQPMFDSLAIFARANDPKGYYAKIKESLPRIEKATGLKVTTDVSPEKVKAYTTLGGAPFLDGQYTVFGKVIKGLDVIDKIAAVAKDQFDRPIDNVPMSMKVESMSRKKIEKEYGYVFPAVKEEGKKK